MSGAQRPVGQSPTQGSSPVLTRVAVTEVGVGVQMLPPSPIAACTWRVSSPLLAYPEFCPQNRVGEPSLQDGGPGMGFKLVSPLSFSLTV